MSESDDRIELSSRRTIKVYHHTSAEEGWRIGWWIFMLLAAIGFVVFLIVCLRVTGWPAAQTPSSIARLCSAQSAYGPGW